MANTQRVLVVDDELYYCQLLESILCKAGYEVVTAHNGAQAMERLSHDRPHLLLLDLNLPDTDGYAVCRQIRADADLGRIPIIMVTVQSEASNIVQGLQEGADDYVTKPFDPKEVLARVSALLKLAAPAP